MRICVTADDIANGQLHDSRKCPIAIAMQRRLKDDTIKVGSFTYTTKTQAHAELPDKAKEFVSDFDHERPVKPFCFTIPDPKETPCVST